MPDDLAFDHAALNAARSKYRAERDKRLRPDGEGQYVELTGRFASYAEHDPYVEPGFTREPVAEEVEVLIIGGGFSGMLASARLIETGVQDIRIVEAGGDFGGTWYWNRYPGAQCDIESYCYLPLLEELGFMPKDKYSYAPEIYEHSQRIGRAYGLYDRALFQTRITAIEWDDAQHRWIASTSRGDRISARFVITAIGTASRPKLPGIPGLESFAGHSFHTSRWDYGYTGGDNTGNLHKLADKRVAIIGTGATAVQCIPHLGRDAEHLYVFQRTPSAVDIRNNQQTDPAWAASLPAGWQRDRRRNFADVLEGKPVEADLINDGWTGAYNKLSSGAIAKLAASGAVDAELAGELADLAKMDEVRSRVDDVVEDPEVGEALKPWYRYFCKRPTFNDEYLATFNRANVTLVDTSASHGVERITPEGLVANGKLHAVDCIVYASGFEVTRGLDKHMKFSITGRGGVSLFDYWKDGYRTLHGFMSHGFPNWFYIGISQNGLAANMTQMFDEQASHIAYIIAQTRARQATVVEPTAEAETDWVAHVRSLAVSRRAFFESCTPGYYNNEGEHRGGLFSEVYAPGVNAFNDVIDAWRSAGDLKGLRLA